MFIWMLRVVALATLVSYPALAESHLYGPYGGGRDTNLLSSPNSSYGAGVCESIRPGDYKPAPASSRPIVNPPSENAQGPKLARNDNKPNSTPNVPSPEKGDLPARPENPKKEDVNQKCSFEGEDWDVFLDVGEDNNVIFAQFKPSGGDIVEMQCQGIGCRHEFKTDNTVERVVRVELEDNLKWIKYWPKEGSEPKRVEVSCQTPVI